LREIRDSPLKQFDQVLDCHQITICRSITFEVLRTQ
jgi:hypothetical protein